MQLMSWIIGRLGSRFALQFEPYQRRVMHSALGRFMDQPLDLAVGLVEPDGTQRVLPFTRDDDVDGITQFAHCEQFERFNSITFRGHSETHGLRFEMNVHSAFYPQNERLCLMPALYFELRVSPVDPFGDADRRAPTPREVDLFLRLKRPYTQIEAGQDRLSLRYDEFLHPDEKPEPQSSKAHRPTVPVEERIVSLNAGCTPTDDGQGLLIRLPVTRPDSGIKWRLVWAAHVAEPVLRVRRDGGVHAARLRYNEHWPDVEAVMGEAVRTRDERLALSRRFEKLLEQAPLDHSQRHLSNQSFQGFLANTFWCTTEPGAAAAGGRLPEPREWFSVWDGSPAHHSPIDVEYNQSIFYLCLWPRLLRLLLTQWLERLTPHPPSNGLIAPHDLGRGVTATGDAWDHPLPVEENANLLLLLETYAHWTGDKALYGTHLSEIKRLARYLVWTDRDGSGFPSEGMANSFNDASPALRFARKQTYLAVKRSAALRAAAGIFHRSGHGDLARQCDALVERDVRKIEKAAWLGDHYAVTVDPSAVELIDPDTAQPLPYERLKGWDAYSIYTGNGLLLPEMIGQPPLLDRERLTTDVYRAQLECQGRYGDGHTSAEPNTLRISQNLWRDLLARYLHLGGASSAQQYWDLQVLSNTHVQSMGVVEHYIQTRVLNSSRGIVALGYYVSSVRLVVDRLAPGATGTYITVNPDRHTPQRWPLLPLADWHAGKIPVCVVNDHGQVSIEAPTDPVVILGQTDDPEATISGIELIG
jgi:hypothetical protein